jgi:hypothetical protein
MVALQDQLAKTPFAMISDESPRTNRIKNPLPRGHTYSFRLIKESRDVSAARESARRHFCVPPTKEQEKARSGGYPATGQPGRGSDRPT